VLFGHRLKNTGNRFARWLVRIVSDVDASITHTHHQILHGLVCREIADNGLGSCLLRPKMHNGLAHGHASPIRTRPVDFVIAPLRLRSAGDVFDCLLDRPLCRIHDAEIVGVRLIRLEHCELRIPPPAQALVAEIAVDFVHAIESADRQPLQIQLGRDAQEQVHVERVVMSLKGTRHRPARNGMHHRRLNFDESLGIEIAAERLHQLAALQKNLAHFGIHHQVHVALPVAQFDISQPVPLLGQRQQVFCEECQFFSVNAEFASTGAKQVSADANVVAQVEEFPEFKAPFANSVLLDIELESLSILLQMREPGLAH
jgi:hypothetical protein